MSPRRTIVWMEPSQGELVRAVASAAGLQIVGAGSASRGSGAMAASAAGTETVSDLRAVMASADVDLVWLASPGEFGLERGDAESVLEAKRRGVRVASLEPVPASALGVVEGGWDRGVGEVRPIDAIAFVPLGRAGRSYREAMELLDAFGPVRLIAVEGWCSPNEGSLGARLMSAIDIVHSLMGEPETVQAVLNTSSALPRTLRGCAGDLAATLRLSDGRCGSLVLCDRGGRWNQKISIVGEGGRLRIFDDGYEWIGAGGEKVEELRQRTRGDEPTLPFAAEAVAEQIARLFDGDRPEIRCDHTAVLTTAEAVLLSARTGQRESPADIRRAAGL